jgi:hypothetical protein
MKHLLCPLVLLLLISCCARSQDSLQSRISHDSAIRATLVQGIKYPNLVYTANGQVLSNREIIARLQLYPEPADELQKYRSGRTGLVVWLGVFLASGITAAVEKGQGNSGAQYSLAGISVAALFAAFVSGGQASAHRDRAIRVYNKRFVP